MSGILLTASNGPIGFIAKLLGYVMDFIYNGLYKLFGIQSIILSIVIITIIIYMCLLPLTIKQQKFSKLSQAMQPEIQKIQNKYKDKKDNASMQAMQQETSLVYQKYGVSPTGSCVQMLIQMPILFGLYRVFYNIPAYITSVKTSLTPLADEIMQTSGDKYIGAFTDLLSKDNGFNYVTSSRINTSNVSNTLTDLVGATDEKSINQLRNFIIDMIYKLPSTGWSDSATTFNNKKVEVTTLVGHFPELSDTISNTFKEMHNYNYFLGMNISDTPLNIIRTNFNTMTSSGFTWALLFAIIIPLLIPVLAYATQLLSIKLMPKAPNTNDQMAAQMKMMNYMMPLMSLVLCFTVPVGLGFYWICTAVVRSIQQLFINRQMKNLNLDDIIAKNEEKLKKKREKMGIAENQIRDAAKIKTKSIEKKAKMSNFDEKEAEIEKANAKKANAKAGSLASKANMVREYNEKNSRK